MRSRITGGRTEPLFEAEVLGKYTVQYYRCVETGFIQTADPYWLSEAYSDAITALDLGLIARNLAATRTASAVIDGWLNRRAQYVDYGGGYGMFVRMMRDRGYDYYRVDPHCQNLFAKGFDWQPADRGRAELLTAWEVFEHLPQPMESLRAMLEISDTILFSTLLVPTETPRSADDWWYFIPETGQHVSLFTGRALEHVAKALNLRYLSDGTATHILTSREIPNPFRPKAKWIALKSWFRARQWLQGRMGRNSLLPQDLETVRKHNSKVDPNSP